MKRMNVFSISMLVLLLGLLKASELKADVDAEYAVSPLLSYRMEITTDGADADPARPAAPEAPPANPPQGAGTCARLSSNPFAQTQSFFNDAASEITCHNERALPGDTGYAQFCSCIKRVTDGSDGNHSDLYPKIGPNAFERIERNAMEAAVALQVNMLRKPLRDITRGLTYAAFNPNLRGMVAPVPGESGLVQPTTSLSDGLACLPSNMGKYVDSLIANETCKPVAMRRLNKAVEGIWKIRGGSGPSGAAFRRSSTGKGKNFGHFLDHAYTNIYVQGMGFQGEVEASVIQSAELLGTSSINDNPEDPEAAAPSDGAATEAGVRSESTDNDDKALRGILYNALLANARGETISLSAAATQTLLRNGLIATQIVSERPDENNHEQIDIEKFKSFLVRLKERVKEPNGSLPSNRRKGKFREKLNAYLRSEVTRNMNRCKTEVLQKLESKICPMISNERFSITSLMGVLATPRERRAFSDMMRLVSGSDNSAAETDQMLCYAYAKDRSTMNSIFTYTSGKPITETSEVFSINPNDIPDHPEYDSFEDQNHADTALLANQRDQGVLIRQNQVPSVSYNQTQVEQISRQYSRRNEENMNKNGKKLGGGGEGGGGGDSGRRAEGERNDDSDSGRSGSGNGGRVAKYNVNSAGYNPGYNPAAFASDSYVGASSGSGSGNGSAGNGGSSGSGNAAGGNGNVDYLARIAELQKMIEEREKKLQDAMTRQNAQVSDSMVASARDRDAEIKSLKDELTKLRADLNSARTQAVARGVVIPTPTPTPATPAKLAAVTPAAPAVPPTQLPSAPKVNGAALIGVNAGAGNGAPNGNGGGQGASLNMATYTGVLKLNGKTWVPGDSQVVVNRSQFESATAANLQQWYTWSGGGQIYVVNEDGETVTVYTAHMEDGEVSFVPQSATPDAQVAKAAKGKKKGRAIASVGKPVVATPTPVPVPDDPVRVMDMNNTLDSGGN